MSDSFFGELKRRNVFRVAVIYVVVSWLLMQIGDVMFPALRLPDWTTTLLVAFLILGLPVALIFAWAFELTPEGVVRTEDVPREQSITRNTGQKINYMIIGVLAIAVVFLLAKIWIFEEAAKTHVVASDDRSIAVLPFKNQSAAKENAEFFSGGLHDELLTLLSRIGDIKVISRTSVERLDPGLSIPEIGALLGVATILEGQVQRAGNRLRINVQLIDTVEEGHLWADTYDSELTAENVFEVQGDIARTIAGALQAELSPEDEKVLDTVETENLEALENYLLGTQIARRRTFSALAEAEAYLVAATQHDPDYAAAWLQLADIYDSQFATGSLGQDEYVRKASAAIDHALELNNSLAGAYAQRGLLQFGMGDYAAAEDSFREALRRDPNNPTALVQYGTFLRSTARPERAAEVLEKALATDPLSTEVLFQLGKAEMYAGRPQRTAKLAERIRQIDPASIYGYLIALQAEIWMGRYDRAWPWYLEAVQADPGDFENWSFMATALQKLGDPELADRHIERAVSLGPDEPTVVRGEAILAYVSGNVDAAYAIAEAALDARLDDRWGSDDTLLRLARDHALETGNYGEILGHYRERCPGLILEDPEIDIYCAPMAPDLALLLRRAGQPEAATNLIRAALAWQSANQPDGVFGYDLGILVVELLALDGQLDAAMRQLERAVDVGWRFEWKFSLSNPNLDGIRDRPAFQAVVGQLESDMAVQLQAIHALPHMGEYDLRDRT